MTLIPTRAGVTLTEVKDRPDLGEYELGDHCMVPGCDELREQGGGHHVWRRSNQTRSYWVELEDGTLVPNRVGLCPQHHRDVTGEIGGHRARIVLDDLGRILFAAKGDDPGPIFWHSKPLEFAYDPFSYLPAALQLTVTGEEKPHGEVVGEHDHGGVKPGEKCPTCKRRVNHAKKKASPKSAVTSMRMPTEDAEVFEDTLEAVAGHVGVKTSEKYWKHKVVTIALAYLLQADARELKAELQGRGG